MTSYTDVARSIFERQLEILAACIPDHVAEFDTLAHKLQTHNLELVTALRDFADDCDNYAPRASALLNAGENVVPTRGEIEGAVQDVHQLYGILSIFQSSSESVPLRTIERVLEYTTAADARNVTRMIAPLRAFYKLSKAFRASIK